jgi:2-hydroxy-3-oxopropionate reductase
VEPKKVMEALSGGLAGNKVMEVKAKKFLEHEFEPGGRAATHRKDLEIALEVGREHAVPLPVTAMVEQMFGTLMARGLGGWDHSALITMLESWAGQEASSNR